MAQFYFPDSIHPLLENPSTTSLQPRVSHASIAFFQLEYIIKNNLFRWPRRIYCILFLKIVGMWKKSASASSWHTKFAHIVRTICWFRDSCVGNSCQSKGTHTRTHTCVPTLAYIKLIIRDVVDVIRFLSLLEKLDIFYCLCSI